MCKVSRVKQADEWVTQGSEWTDKQVAQSFRLDSWCFWTLVYWPHTPYCSCPTEFLFFLVLLTQFLIALDQLHFDLAQGRKLIYAARCGCGCGCGHGRILSLSFARLGDKGGFSNAFLSFYCFCHHISFFFSFSLVRLSLYRQNGRCKWPLWRSPLLFPSIFPAYSSETSK